ncbi:hypothetical protein D9619_003093 [Psilocybe cf. subviscida]|uniref:HMG box domain-containing protein n=1 Tax=Psilocybe cf. subviscida TaxID=2480587 RepID=A0A8H5EUB0_9AGAR|nr:hypothetical protein D9619_003093 [Psilocybe cf. subviscida]
MDPPNMLTYVGLNGSFVHPDQCATPAHERQQQRDSRLGSPWQSPSTIINAHSPQSYPQTPVRASSSFNTSDASDASRPSPERVRRPRNAFMIFRSEFNSMRDKISRNVEHDNRHISRIVGHYWNQMSEEEKDVWRKRADQEKVEHMRKYPGYKFAPLARTKKLKRNVKRNGDDEMERCRLVAELLLEGKQGDELLTALKASDPRDNNLKVEESSPAIMSPRGEERPHEEPDPFVSTARFHAFKYPLVPPNVDPQTNNPSTAFMGTGANVGQGHYNTQRFYIQPQELCEHSGNCPEMTPMPAMRDDAARSDCAQYLDMRIDISSPTHMQSPYSPQSQYLMTPPANFDEGYRSPQIQGEMTYSRYAGVHLSPPYGADMYYSGKRRLPPPAVTFRNPFANHQNQRSYVYSSPPPSPTDIRGFRGDPAVLRRQQDGGQ